MPDVSVVIKQAMPPSKMEMVQEMGRCGREARVDVERRDEYMFILELENMCT